MSALRTAKASLRPPRVPEKAEQAHGVQLLRTLGAKVYTLGTVRRRGDFPGTMQTPGIGDVYSLLPAPRSGGGSACGLWWEVKAVGGRFRPEQAAFREACAAAGVPHIVGGFNDLIGFLVTGGWLTPDSVAHYRIP